MGRGWGGLSKPRKQRRPPSIIITDWIHNRANSTPSVCCTIIIISHHLQRSAHPYGGNRAGGLTSMPDHLCDETGGGRRMLVCHYGIWCLRRRIHCGVCITRYGRSRQQAKHDMYNMSCLFGRQARVKCCADAENSL